jgi:hypothetical protein
MNSRYLARIRDSAGGSVESVRSFVCEGGTLEPDRWLRGFQEPHRSIIERQTGFAARQRVLASDEGIG